MSFIALKDTDQYVIVNLNNVTSIEFESLNSFGDGKVYIYTTDRDKPISIKLSARMHNAVLKYLAEKTKCGKACMTEYVFEGSD